MATSLAAAPAYFGKDQLTNAIICFPDREFLNSRIAKGSQICQAYATIVASTGLLYTFSDTEDASQWLDAQFDNDLGLWERVIEDDAPGDFTITAMDGIGQDTRFKNSNAMIWRRT